jgi:hypothetical protein
MSHISWPPDEMFEKFQRLHRKFCQPKCKEHIDEIPTPEINNDGRQAGRSYISLSATDGHPIQKAEPMHIIGVAQLDS